MSWSDSVTLGKGLTDDEDRVEWSRPSNGGPPVPLLPPRRGATIVKGAEMATGVLTIAELVVNKPDYVKLKDAAGKSWNCNEQRLLRNAKDGKPVFSVGRQLQVEYKESQPVGQRFPARWINDVALAPAGTSDTFQPHGEGHGSGMKSNGEFRTPEQIMRGQSLECAASFAKSAEEALEVARTFFYPYIFGEFEPRDELAVAAATVAEVLPVTPVEDDESEYPF